ncbi:TetR/AcrR family transcriptional regulator [Streptomyces niveus]|uniref:TetR/AcrR family transcriptional regulator n=2 Tax=Streptomyces niveus TaxID=193462 RepID=UPI0036822E96
MDSVTMDGLAERAGLGKGTVFRRFGTRAGIFRALLEDDEIRFQGQVLSGPPPLGPGAEPVERLVAYGRARIDFLLDRHAIARASFHRNRPEPVGNPSVSQLHIRVLLRQAAAIPGLDGVTIQLTAALEGPLRTPGALTGAPGRGRAVAGRRGYARSAFPAAVDGDAASRAAARQPPTGG